METRSKLDERFWGKVTLTPLCWNWVGALRGNGYGQVKIKGKNVRPHRYVWEVFNGAIPKGFYVRHSCDNPKCVRIDHLFLGTPQDNMLDKEVKGRARHTKGSRNSNAKLHESQIKAIREDPRIRKEVAVDYGVSRQTVQAIKEGRAWKHV